MKDMGNASYVLGVEIHRDQNKGTLGLTQRNYLKSVLKRFSMEDCNHAFVPLTAGIKLSEEMCPKTPEERKRMENTPYAPALGSLMYAGIEHWKQIKHALRYVKAPLDYSLCFNQKDLQLQGYTDADWQGDPDDRKTTSGYLFTPGVVQYLGEARSKIQWQCLPWGRSILPHLILLRRLSG
jgi:hypothetical protein